ncbi:HAMP domain-containing sensor histidine kinase [Alteromonas sp. ASW11-36]|uniref:histidine kinase n=1 Tax=Alteromonas arenosi TaxID=3055817 RepID=A0ABT7SXV1_9ALTE|nr:HAMP domain-containing sensor histidine kinase [Alteromonas sp. ASW11-36]MDM7860372.1 HAMP domain-containing sensor histidine kinase [Alteromonas sp. ASW11-36]
MFFEIDTSAFMPHGHCILWKPELLFPIVLSEIMIFIAYTSIPIAIFRFHRNRPDLDKDSKKILLLFFFFIQLCGITHLISAYNYWHSEYVLAMFVKVATAVVSLLTAYTLFKVLPKIINLPSPKQHLKLIEELKTLNSQLEDEVQNRTALITKQNTLLETLVEGYPGSIVKYEPKLENGNIVDFHSTVVFDKASLVDGIAKNDQDVGKSMLAAFPDFAENGHFDSAIDAYMNDKQVIEDPIYNRTLNKYFRVVSFKKPDMDFLLVYFTDVTERENLKLDAINNSKLISLGELSGAVAHEINNPLQIISGSAEMLQNSVSSEDFVGAKCLKNIHSTVVKISQIIDNLRRLSRNETGKIDSVDVNNVVKKTVQLYEQRIKLKDIKLIEVYETGDNAYVQTIEVNLIQILNNLLSNAIDALHSNSTNDKSLIIKVERDHCDIIIKIINNGPLIKEEVKERMFEPLFTTKDVGEGTGLGLSLSRRLAEEMNAALLFEQTNEAVMFILRIKSIDENSLRR